MHNNFYLQQQVYISHVYRDNNYRGHVKNTRVTEPYTDFSVLRKKSSTFRAARVTHCVQIREFDEIEITENQQKRQFDI